MSQLVSYLASDMLPSHPPTCCSDATAAACAKAVRTQLKELEAQQQVLAAEVAAEKEAQEHLQQLK